MTTRLRFVSWAAVSTKEQLNKVSIPDQLRINREHAETRGGEVVAELVVPGESRSIVLFEDACARIEAYATLRDMIAARSFDVLIFRDRSRLGRTVSLVTAVTELCREAGIALYDVESPPETLQVSSSYDDLLIGAIKAVGSQREVSEIRRRHLHGMIGRTKKGLLPRGAIFGYRYLYDERGRYIGMVKDEPHASAVRRLFDLYLDGKGMPSVADVLNSERWRTPRGDLPWSKKSVEGVLRNAWKYAGYAELNRKRSPRTKGTARPYVRSKGEWEPIISAEEAERSVEERRQRSTFRQLPETKERLRGLCVCALCGKRMYIGGSGPKQANGESARYYVRCKLHTPDVSTRYEVVYNEVQRHLENWQRDGISEDGDDDVSAVIDAFVLQKKVTLGTIERDNAALGRLDNAFADGTLDDERYRAQVARIRERIRESLEEIERVDYEISEVKIHGTVHRRAKETAEFGIDVFHNPNVTASNAWFRHRIRIVVGRKQVVRIERI